MTEMLLSLDRMRTGRYALYGISIAVVVFLLLPIALIAVLSFGSSQWLQFPPPSWTFKWYREFLSDPRWIETSLTSLKLASIVMVCSISLGLPTAFVIVRRRIMGTAFLRGLFISPMIVPVVIVAIALYSMALKFGLGGTLVGMVCGHLILALPFSVISISNGLEQFDQSIEKAAVVCGASPLQAICRITLPSIKGSIFAGALFSFLTSWDEVVLSIFMSSPTLQTLPVKMWAALRIDLSPAIAVASTLLTLTTIVVMGLVAVVSNRRTAR